MTIFDLSFIALFLAGTGVFIAAVVTALRGNWRWATGMLVRLALCAAAYLGIVVVVSVATPQRFAKIGENQCSDDWCIAVAGVIRGSSSAGVLYNVSFRVSSRAIRVVQREHNVVVYLLDGVGRRYDADRSPDGAPFDVSLEPGQAVSTTRHFVVPAGARDVRLVISREGGVPTPECCVIGAEGSLLHKRTMVRLG